MSNYVKSISVTTVLDSGETHTFVIHDPSPIGSSTLIPQQVRRAMGTAERSTLNAILANAEGKAGRIL